VIVSKTGSNFKKGREPHNASTGEEFGNIAELVRRLAAETKRVRINGDDVAMSWAERSFRLAIDRALAGSRRDLAQLLRIMIDHPSIARSYRVQIYLGGLA
jgi:hypothetical protein